MIEGNAEQWAPIADTDGFEVSDLGRVRDKDGNLLKLGRFKQSAPYPTVYVPGLKGMRLVHRLVLEAFVGPCPEGMEACHNDGNHADSSLANLRWDTRKGNMRDRINHGTHNNSRKTECNNGHEYTDENTRVTIIRVCIACEKASVARAKKRRQKRRARKLGTQQSEMRSGQLNLLAMSAEPKPKKPRAVKEPKVRKPRKPRIKLALIRLSCPVCDAPRVFQNPETLTLYCNRCPEGSLMAMGLTPVEFWELSEGVAS